MTKISNTKVSNIIVTSSSTPPPPASPYWISKSDPVAGGIVDSCIDYAGNTLVIGTEFSTGMHMFVAKYDTSGGLLYSTRILTYPPTVSGTGDRGMFIVDQGGSALVAFRYDSAGNGSVVDTVLMKFDDTGNIVWQTSYSKGSGYAVAINDICIDASNNICIVGAVVDISVPGVRVDTSSFIIQAAPFGNINWQKTYGTYASGTGGSFYSVTVDSSYNIWVGGAIQISGFAKGVVVKYSRTDGTVQQNSAYVYPSSFGVGYYNTIVPTGIAADAAGNILISGRTVNLAGGIVDSVTMKLTSAGGIVWQRALSGGGSASIYTNGISLDASGNAFTGGYVYNDPNVNAVILKYTSAEGGTGFLGGISYSPATDGLVSYGNLGVSGSNIVYTGGMDDNAASTGADTVATLSGAAVQTGVYSNFSYFDLSYSPVYLALAGWFIPQTIPTADAGFSTPTPSVSNETYILTTIVTPIV
jgi:hypothetical protein